MSDVFTKIWYAAQFWLISLEADNSFEDSHDVLNEFRTSLAKRLLQGRKFWTEFV